MSARYLLQNVPYLPTTRLRLGQMKADFQEMGPPNSNMEDGSVSVLGRRNSCIV